MRRLVVAALGSAAVAVTLLGAPSALADNRTVSEWDDPGSRISAQGDVRPADMIDHKIESPMFEPQGARELDAISKSWRKSFCFKGETSRGPLVGSERCSDRGR
jgi:hypothetical protein